MAVPPLSPTALTTLQNLKDALGITDTALDTRMTWMIGVISDAFVAYCNRAFEFRAWLERLTATGYQELTLRGKPLVVVSQVLLGVADDGTGGYAITDFQVADPNDLEYATLYRDAGWPDGRLSNGTLVYNTNRYTPYGAPTSGDSIQAYDPSPFAFRKNIQVQYTAGYVLPQYQQRATVANASPTVAGLGVTDNLLGLNVYGTGISDGTTVGAVNSATSITLSANATSSGTPLLTFGPAGITLATRLPLRLEGAVWMEADRMYSLNLARGLKTQRTSLGDAVTFYNDASIDPQVQKILDTFKEHCAG